MSDSHTTSETETESDDEYTSLAIEGELPLKAVGIENLKEANPKHMPPHRYIHPWFARRPTPAARLAILGSVMEEGTSADELLSLMQIGPDGLEENISEYVQERKTTEGQRDGTLGEWYGYPRPFTQSPSEAELENLHDTLRETWGELPTVLDATAGGGVIPFESIRYGLPTVANELNPVPSVILKIMLEYAPEVGSLEDELYHWRDEIKETAQSNLERYYPTQRDGREILASACTYTINCEACGGTIPLVPKWWLQKKSSSEGVAIKPHYDQGDVEYECVEITGSSDFNPQDGTVSRRDAECPHCGVITEDEDIKGKFQNGEFDFSVYGVKYSDHNGRSGYRAGTAEDLEALSAAEERIESDFGLMTFLATEIPTGKETSRLHRYGIDEWRDVFNPRQLIAQYEYLQAFKKHAQQIRESYTEEVAEAILTILTVVASKMIDRNSRISAWDTGRGYPANMFMSNSYSVARSFADNNPSTTGMGYEANSRKVIDCYEEMVEMVQGREKASVYCGDAADLSTSISSGDVQAAVIDPPYYDSIMYAELADVFYVIQKEYLGDLHPSLFNKKLTNKRDEAVANPARFSGLDKSESGATLAKENYEQKMQSIFGELNEVLETGGVLTIMFTHKETDAWDTLAMSLITAGFTITATHPITSEIPQRAGMQGQQSADSTILLTGRKPSEEDQSENEGKTLWDDIREKTREEAKEAARDLLDSGLSLTKTDTIIAAFGPTLRVYADNYPVVDKKGNEVPPRDALTTARDAVAEVLAERYLDTKGFDALDGLTRWYVLSWLIYGSDKVPYDEARQLGIGVGINIDDVKRDTKIWGKSSGDVQLKTHSNRVQDIVRLESGESVSSRKYPVNPTAERFSHGIDAVHSAIHVYETKGPQAAWEWLSDRGMKNDERFRTTVTALLEVLPAEHNIAETLRDMLSGRTGEYLDIDISSINLNVRSADEDSGPQSDLAQFK